jgi:hypothetical protein
VVAACAQSKPPRLTNEREWAGKGQWVRGDLHTHSRMSDGSADILTLASQAVRFGCDAIAITDHANHDLKGASPEYMAALTAARATQSSLVIVPGLEWNVPPTEGTEHASVLVPDDAGTGQLLAEFKQRFDDFDRPDKSHPKVEDALAWLTQTSRNLPVKPVVIYNHPSRKDTTSSSNVDDITAWRTGNDLVIGFEGAPGHQGKLPIGSYGEKLPAIDRWDPVAANPGDAWDTLLQRGLDVHGAMAFSDFHNDTASDLADYWPCQFAETWFYVPEKSTAGILTALRAGAFFGAHGHIVRERELTLLAEGLPRAATTGEGIQVAEGTEVAAVLSFEVPALDWQQKSNSVDKAEFIMMTPTKVETRVRDITGAGAQVAGERFTVPKEGMVIRARVRRTVPDGPDLVAYTNAVRVRSW